MISKEDRKNFLIEMGARDDELEEILEYNRNVFNLKDNNLEKILDNPFSDELFVNPWKGYLESSREIGVAELLKKKFPQFKFSVAKGISKSLEYREATLKGKGWEKIKSPVIFQSPKGINLELYDSLAGKIPVLNVSNRKDFEMIVRIFSMKNEPLEIRDSVGAFFIKGFNNWDRINLYRDQCDDMVLKNKIPDKKYYKDKFIILSEGFYSGISSKHMELSDEKWKELSLIIRKEHESTHYFTDRRYGSAKNNLLDELIADTMGIIEATGEFKSEWFLKFIGLENYPKYNINGRLENYRGSNFESNHSWIIMQKLIYMAAKNLEKINLEVDFEDKKIGKLKVLNKLCNMTLEEIALAERFF